MNSPKQPKVRADELLLSKGLVESRNKAQALIMAGKVEMLDRKNQWTPVLKAGQQFRVETEMRLVGEQDHDVGRGAKKLRAALDYWPDFTAKIKGARCLDIGSSTGGFTQVLLDAGAEEVVGIDVGTHQLHERLRSDPRVKCFEQTHVLKIQDDFWPHNRVQIPFDIIVTDLSFISVTKVLLHAQDWLRDGGSWVILVKPQFELDAHKTPKGIVSDEAHRQEALRKVKDCVGLMKGFQIKDAKDCPVSGTKGNREFFLWIEKHLYA